MRSRVRRALLLLATGLLASGQALAQAGVTLPVDDPVYRDIDRLISAGVVVQVVAGQRPYSLAMVTHIAAEAAAFLDSAAGTGATKWELERRAVARLAARTNGRADSDRSGVLGALASAYTPRALRVSELTTDEESRAVPPNGLGAVEADVNTLTDNRNGRRYVSGTTAAVESDHWVALRSGISLQLRPRIAAFLPRADGANGVTGELLAGSVRIVHRNLGLTVGREYTLWAPAGEAGLFFSANAPALDLIRLTSESPFRLPSLFRSLGLIAGTIQVADLGASVSNNHSLLVSYKVSARPSNILELGATFENHFGGAGARNPSAFNRFADLTPFLDIFRHHSDSTDFDSDKLLGADARLRVPPLGNVTLYGEFALEDFDPHRLKSIFTEDAAYSGGILIPALVSPSLSARIGYHRTGLRFYEHHLVMNGIASRRFILGDDLGRDAQGGTVAVQWQSLRDWELGFEGAAEERRDDQYEGSYVNPDLTGLVFRRVSTAPPERRIRGMLGVRRSSGNGAYALDVHVGAERIRNFAFIASNSQTHGIMAITIARYY
jgi:Capsule assembly protein Wzi